MMVVMLGFVCDDEEPRGNDLVRRVGHTFQVGKHKAPFTFAALRLSRILEKTYVSNQDYAEWQQNSSHMWHEHQGDGLAARLYPLLRQQWTPRGNALAKLTSSLNKDRTDVASGCYA
jgi:hypothetical protein